MIRVALGLLVGGMLLAGTAGCAVFDDYDSYGDPYGYPAPAYAPQAAYAPQSYAPAPRSSCGCAAGAHSMHPPATPPPPVSASVPPPPPAPGSAYQPTTHIIPASASQSREPDLLNR